MRIVDRIRKLGFHRWYERLLIEAHLWFASCILGLVVFFAGVELIFESGRLQTTLLGVATVIGGGLVTVLCLQRYIYLMVLGQRLSSAATCARCDSNGRFTILDASSDARDDIDAKPGVRRVWLRVKCRNCGHEWTLE